ncbi:hypothetical protein L596_002117 [Steinernema carpocapsae]|uniref:Galactosylgalactosylxylosylprotein 3-beta-glucuronosyltransferase n=1 Tax=Steinernema carpocapsae TaxID=34508 RepID=A0A4U8UNR3_STECR|nr:hypothetical protein L596_002117 [Steinernema carpocapsae]
MIFPGGGQVTKNNMLTKVLIAISLFFCCQLILFWSNLEDFDEKAAALQVTVARLERRRDQLRTNIMDLERESYRMNNTVKKMEILLKDRSTAYKRASALPPIFFVTPTYYRLTQKSDLTRLAQTLYAVPNLVWVVIEDADEISDGVSTILIASGLQYGHLHRATPKEKTINGSKIIGRGAFQRNQALAWMRTNFAGVRKGVVYFGDDDNTYDWRLFEEMRTIVNAGVWPVGTVGGQLVEGPVVNENGSVVGFNAHWKPNRPFPIDMAAFAVNISLIHANPKASFPYTRPIGYLCSKLWSE